MLSNSGIEKRRYTKGYHIDFVTKHTLNRDTETENQPVLKHSIKERIQQAILLAAVKKIAHLNEREKTSPLAMFQTRSGQQKTGDHAIQLIEHDSVRCGDEIIFRSGDRVMAKVISVGVNDITYLKCDNINGPTYVAKKSTVFMIEYTNGVKDVFDTQPEEDNDYYVQGGYDEEIAESNESFATTSLVLGILSIVLIGYFGFILGILGIVFGRKALERIRNSEGKLKGEGKARTGVVLSIVSIALTALVIFFLFALILAL